VVEIVVAGAFAHGAVLFLVRDQADVGVVVGAVRTGIGVVDSACEAAVGIMDRALDRLEEARVADAAVVEVVGLVDVAAAVSVRTPVVVVIGAAGAVVVQDRAGEAAIGGSHTALDVQVHAVVAGVAVVEVVVARFGAGGLALETDIGIVILAVGVLR